jgi:hypothetical protein
VVDPTDPPKDPELDPPTDPDNDPDNLDNPPDPDKGKDKDKDPPKDPELEKAIRRRDRALADKKKLEDELAALRAKHEPDKVDPVKAANRRLVTASARTVLTAAGITEKDDQKAVIGFLDLDSVSVTDDGDVDEDTIQERVEELKRIFGRNAGTPRPRSPRVDPRDKGGDNAKPEDAASRRRREMLGIR